MSSKDSKEQCRSRAGGNRFVQRVNDCLAQIVAVLGSTMIIGGFVAWASLGQAQKDIADIKADDKAMAEAIEKIPLIQKDIEYIAGAIAEINKSMEKVATAIEQDNVRDAKNHHTH